MAGSGNSTWTGNLSLTADTTLLVNNTGDGDNLLFAGNLTDTGANRLSLVTEGGSIDSNLWLTGTNSFTGGITVDRGRLFCSVTTLPLPAPATSSRSTAASCRPRTATPSAVIRTPPSSS